MDIRVLILLKKRSSYSSSYSEPSYGSDESYATHGFSKQNGQWVDKNGNPAA